MLFFCELYFFALTWLLLLLLLLLLLNSREFLTWILTEVWVTASLLIPLRLFEVFKLIPTGLRFGHSWFFILTPVCLVYFSCLSGPFTINITVTFAFHSFFSSLAKSMYFSSFIFTLYFGGIVKSMSIIYLDLIWCFVVLYLLVIVNSSRRQTPAINKESRM